MTLEQIEPTLRSPNRADYPELDGYTAEQIYRDSLGPGSLYLTARMARTMHLRPGDIVLDLGCGCGETSIYLAKRFDVQVVAVDLWTPATDLNDKFTTRGYRDRITPLHLDATNELPFADGYFDAIFCMNSFSFYGGSVEFLAHLLKHLKAGGEFCVGSEGFNAEFMPEERANPPAPFAWQHPGGFSIWEDDFSKQHSPEWWKDLFEKSGLLRVTDCFELPDADILFEDTFLHDIERGDDPFDIEKMLEQLAYNRTHSPHQTLYVVAAIKLKE
ncbi:MAG: methyltransferase domain-containing protein [Anaerolineae bacterium]|nr:methyltransferase domain-containing protein [Anaerolineae bacterium]